MHTHDTPPARRRLSDILNGGADSLRSQWTTTEAAGDFKPLPTGVYVARIASGELSKAKTGTPGYKLCFKVLEGEHAGRLLWHDIWLTPAALPMAKRDLAKLGVTDPVQLESPLPPGIRCAVKVTLRREDDGTEHNRVKHFDVIGIDADPTADADFAPSTESEGAALTPSTTTTPADAADDGTPAAGSLLDVTPLPEKGDAFYEH